MLKTLIPAKFYCGFDLGTVSVKAALLKDMDRQPPELLGVYEAKTAGFKNHSLTDLVEFSDCVHSTIAGLQAKTGVKCKAIQLGIGGELIDKRFSNALIPLLERGTKVISNYDLRKVNDQAKNLGANLEEHVLHNIPQYYRVDDTNTALNPLGLYGRKIEVHALLILVKNILLQNLIKGIDHAGFDVANVFYTSYSSAQACLSEYHRRQGCVLVDMGALATDILIFKDGYMRYVVNVPLGGEHLTQAIAHRLNIHTDLAEEIKKSYAFALSSDTRSEEEILIKGEEGYLPLKKDLIAQALEATVSRFIELVTEAIKNSGLVDQINAGIVISGGGSLLPGLDERLESASKLSVKIGKLTITTKQLPQAAKYFAAIGLAQSGLSKSLGSSVNSGPLSLKQNLSEKILEIYQEYF